MNKATIVVLALTLTVVFLGLSYYTHTSSKKTTLGAIEVPSTVLDLWTHWKTQNNKKYETEEEYRLTVFHQNYQKVMIHQQDPNKTYNMGFTEFMDLTDEEFKSNYLSTYVPINLTQTPATYLPELSLPNSVDWRNKAVTEVKNQRQCGSCWAFSSTGALEGLSFVSGKGLKSFSEQQLVDCSTSQGNEGCKGGSVDQAFKYVEQNGIHYESKYPYRASDKKCVKVNGASFKIKGFNYVANGDVDQLAAAVVQQPVAIAVGAKNWEFYVSGVFSHRDCNTNLDHAVLLVGYTPDYWIVKNSWGANWGEKGYMRLERGNSCGLANFALYPTA